MKPEEIIPLFNKFYDQTINLDGLVLFLDEIHEGKNSSYDFYFKMSNPNNISYYKGIVEQDLISIIDDFCSYLNIQGHPYIIGPEETLYFNEELRNKIKNVFKKVKSIDFDESYYSPTTNKGVELIYSIHIDHIKIKEYWDYDSISIYNVVKPTRALLNGKPCDIRNALYAYEEFLSDKETYYETEKYYVEIDSILNDYPLVSTEYTAQYYHTKFI